MQGSTDWTRLSHQLFCALGLPSGHLWEELVITSTAAGAHCIVCGRLTGSHPEVTSECRGVTSKLCAVHTMSRHLQAAMHPDCSNKALRRCSRPCLHVWTACCSMVLCCLAVKGARASPVNCTHVFIIHVLAMSASLSLNFLLGDNAAALTCAHLLHTVWSTTHTPEATVAGHWKAFQQGLHRNDSNSKLCCWQLVCQPVAVCNRHQL